jgi:drug/metabolite transporter (DMT)-like permease
MSADVERPAAADRSRRNRRGIVLILLSAMLFTFGDVLSKWLTTLLPVGQLMILRGLASFTLMFPVIQRAGWKRVFGFQRLGLQLLRFAFITCEIACFFVAVKYMQLAEVKAAYQAAPLIVAALSILLLRESWTLGELLAMLGGAIGMFLILQPEPGAITWVAALTLLGSVTYALQIFIAKILNDATSTSLVAGHVGGTALAGLLLLWQGWVTPDWSTVAAIFLMSLFSVVGQACATQAWRGSDATAIAPFVYTSLLWGIGLGWLFFGDRPSPAMLAGSAIIVAAGCYVFYSRRA